MRYAAVAGKFYPADKGELKRQINGFFSSLDIASTKNKDVRAMIVPHAGYNYSGKCAACAYKHIDDKKFDRIIILGTNHSGLGKKISLAIDDFDTPLGTIDCDMGIIENLIVESEKEGLEIGVDEHAHKYEHSIEVQLPFLQVLQKKFKIVPILLRNLDMGEISDFARILAKIMRKDKNILLIASSDFTHYGKSYGFVPFSDNVRENLYNLDSLAIASILKLDTGDFLEKSKETTICGNLAIACLVEASKNMKLKADKVCYYTSGDISKDWDTAVGYAGIVFS